jgi:crossover junction endodeoxyribonuclease RuvC
MVDVGVILTDKDDSLDQRLLNLNAELVAWIEKINPDVVAIERVFSQLNVRTAMGTAQAAGVAMLVAAQRKIPVIHHTPSEVKASVTGSGRADKKQVAHMVVKILGLAEAPKPVDSTDALALAICHLWRGKGNSLQAKAVEKAKSRIASRSLNSPKIASEKKSNSIVRRKSTASSVSNSKVVTRGKKITNSNSGKEGQ